MIPLVQLLFLFLFVPPCVILHHDLLISYFAFYLRSGIHTPLNQQTTPEFLGFRVSVHIFIGSWSIFTLHSPAAMWSVTRPDLVRESTGSGPWIDWIWCVDPRLCLLNLLRNHLTWTYLFNMLNTTKHVFSWYYLYFLMWYKCRFYPLLCDTYVIRF